MTGVHLLMKGKGMVLKSACPFTGLLSEHFYTVCLSVGVSDALQMMSHSRARVDPTQKLPLLPECGQVLLERVGFFSRIFFSLLFLSAAGESAKCSGFARCPIFSGLRTRTLSFVLSLSLGVS